MHEEVVRALAVGRTRFSYRILRRPSPRTEPVIVIGGGFQGSNGWPHMEDRITPVASLVTADLPGMGESDPLPPGAGTEFMATAIDRIIDDLDVPRVNLFGYSYGAELAFGCARRNPHRIARLALGGVVSHTGAAQRASLRQAAEHLENGDVEAFATVAARMQLCLDEDRHIPRRSLVYRYVRRSMLHVAVQVPHVMDSLRRSLISGPAFDGGLTGVPALVFTGEHDSITAPALQREFAATIAGSRFLTIKDSDHWVVLERAADVADLATRFFTDEPLGSAPYVAAWDSPAPGGKTLALSAAGHHGPRSSLHPQMAGSTEQRTAPVDDRLRVIALEVADDLRELATVRTWAARVVQDLPEDQRLDVLTVVGELTSNALRHGEPPRQIRLLRKPGWLCVEVDDTCLDSACPRPPSTTGGHGLTLVAAISASWGQRQRATGKTVWAEIELPRAHEPDHVH
ncbi:alpha/beta fold hydrolase [Amycolatopsis sp. WQ 127309]|uniref:alpha/beta fold hydrolase n=1 Tax=Amycolatopsis sp. WQ 127309 TaxID=2932773 RepID=UPI001FF6FC1D|nr:alpha/beta fold hydrolase [Amycolatopsis sp. WQ 127309]UOZ10674.1 alpha/beta fold hydrolase [Amycolatopsis sp. WQ 127309]